MNNDSIQDSTRYLVEKEHYGNIMPGNRAEMLRDIYLQSGAKVIGGIYGNELYINGNDISVEGAVYCKSNIQFNFSGSKEKKQNIVFKSVVACSGNILIPSGSNKVRFLSDIYSGKINLKNCIVYGNVYATSAIIENAIILGGIYCKKSLKIKNSIIFTFRSNECVVNENVSLLSPFGFAEKINLESTVNVLSFAALWNNDKKENISGKLKLDETDVYEIELEKKDKTNIENSKKIQILSVAERLLNTTEIIQNFKQNKQFIEFLSLNSHLTEQAKQSFTTTNIEEIEKELWKIIEEKSEIQELSGAKSIIQLFKDYNNVN